MPIKTRFWVDLIILLGFLIAFEPHSTGLPIHEWLMLGGCAAIIIHILLHWDWLSTTTIRFFQSLPNRARLNYFIIWLVFVGMITIITSGLMISENVLPAFGFDFITDILWRRIHSLASNLTLLLAAVHFALHWSWVKRILIDLIVDPFHNH